MMSVVYKKGPWSTAEDAQLLHLIQVTGPAQWVKISQQMGTRSAKQCRERYHQNLKPTLRHDPITPEEGRIIEQLVEQIGKRWADIARKLNNRSDNHVKNWWNSNNSHQKRPKSSSRTPTRLFRDPAEDYQHHHHHHHSYGSSQPHHAVRAYSHNHHGHHGFPPSSTSYNHVQYRRRQHSWSAHPELPSPSMPTGGEPLDRVPSLMSDASSAHSTSPKSMPVPGTPDSPPILPPLKLDGSESNPWEFKLTFRDGNRPSQVTLPPLRHAMGGHQLPTAPSSPTDTRPGPSAPHHFAYEAPRNRVAGQLQLPPLSDALRQQPVSSSSGASYGYPSRTEHGRRRF